MAQDALKILPGIEPPRPFQTAGTVTVKKSPFFTGAAITGSPSGCCQVITHGLDLAAVAASWSPCGFSPSQEWEMDGTQLMAV